MAETLTGNSNGEKKAMNSLPARNSALRVHVPCSNYSVASRDNSQLFPAYLSTITLTDCEL